MTSLVAIKNNLEAQKKAQSDNQQAAQLFFNGADDFAARKNAMMMEAQRDAQNGIARIEFRNDRYAR